MLVQPCGLTAVSMEIIVYAIIAAATFICPTRKERSDDPDEPARSLAGPGAGSEGRDRCRCRRRCRLARAVGGHERPGNDARDAARRAALPPDREDARLP